MTDPAPELAELYRHHYRDVVAPLVRIVGFELAEDLAQEAFAVALEQWSDGVPDEPLAWLRRVARNRAIDRIRRSRRWTEKAERLKGEAALPPVEPREPDEIADDLLRLLFTCCHPALAPQARIALTLHTVGGLTSDELARAFLVSRATLQQRLVRAKRKIDTARIPYVVPTVRDMPERLRSVLQTLYVLFTEGYASTRHDDLVRVDLCEEAIRLVRLVRRLVPDPPEVDALLALMLLHHARSPARVDAEGQLVPLSEQDRSLWDREAIEQALPLVEACLRARPVPPYAIEAAIAALHDRAERAEDTDWAQIAALYGELRRRGPESPVVTLNHAVAIAMSGEVKSGLDMLEALLEAGELERYHLLHVARADLLERLDRPAEARAALDRALELATSPTERAFLQGRLARPED